MFFSKSDTFGTVNQGSPEKRNTVSHLYIGKSANAAKYTTFAIRSLAIFKKILKQESIQSSYADGNGLVSYKIIFLNNGIFLFLSVISLRITTNTTVMHRLCLLWAVNH